MTDSEYCTYGDHGGNASDDLPNKIPKAVNTDDGLELYDIVRILR
jgi:hypothetical protein